MSNLLISVDKLLCHYLGLDKAELIPHSVNKKGKQLVVVNTESYKRHIHETLIIDMNLSEMNRENKEKLGMAIGQAIATNLVVSFDEITVKEEKNHA